MPRTDKLERVAELKRRIEDSNALLLTEYRGLTVSEITTLRRSLRDSDASFATASSSSSAGLTSVPGSSAMFRAGCEPTRLPERSSAPVSGSIHRCN